MASIAIENDALRKFVALHKLNMSMRTFYPGESQVALSISKFSLF